MSRLGWTLEQRAGVKWFFMLGSIAAVFGLILGIALVAMGNTGGWALVAIAVVTWSAGYVTLKNIRKSQP
ncbi:hypothetical protein [Streptomyces sp. NPDC097619]|uniref:hypothetical protein n=1 Tax=Streptomyces sp. NPDC097619 TaxID=3157228 RepID=UPI00331B87A0